MDKQAVKDLQSQSEQKFSELSNTIEEQKIELFKLQGEYRAYSSVLDILDKVKIKKEKK